MKPYIVDEICKYLCKSTKNCIPIHKHRLVYWELTIVLKGTLIYTINGTEYILENKDIILAPKDALRERAGGTKADYISFNFTIFPNVTLPTKILYKNAFNSEIEKIVSIFPQKRILWDNNFNAMDYEREKITNLCNYVIFELLSKTDFKFEINNVHIHAAVAYINDNLLKRISLDDLSRHLHLCKEYTASLFKKELGLTVTEYINKRKMLYAKNAILSNNISLSALAQKLGYSSYGYFLRVFKKYYNTSPSKYLIDTQNIQNVQGAEYEDTPL